MNQPHLISELLAIEAEAETLRKRCYSVRKQLEGVSTPSARKGKRKGLTEDEKRAFIDKFRKSLYKKAARGN